MIAYTTILDGDKTSSSETIQIGEIVEEVRHRVDARTKDCYVSRLRRVNAAEKRSGIFNYSVKNTMENEDEDGNHY